MHPFKIEVKCGTRTCLTSVTAQKGILQGFVGLVGLNFVMKSKQLFHDTAKKQTEILHAVKQRSVFYQFTKILS